MSRFVKVHGPTILWAVLIFVLSSIPSLRPPDIGFSLQDKLFHFLEFGVFGFFLQRSFAHVYGNRFRVYFIVLTVGAAYGALDEIHQSFVRGREAELFDFLADTTGIVFAQIVFWTVNRMNLFK